MVKRPSPLFDNGKTYIIYIFIIIIISEKPVVHFCQHQEVTGNSVNLVFSGNYLLPMNNPSSNPTKCLCTIRVHSDDGFRIAAPELRLMPESKECQPTTALHGITDSEINCSGPISNIEMSTMTFHDKTLKLSFENLSPPEFIWVKIDASGKYDVSIAFVKHSSR